MMKKKEKMNPEGSGQVGETKDSASAEVPKPAFPLGRWSIIKNPFSPHRIHKAALPPVQGELSLDMVKPVRNDLSDADLEIVLVPKEPMKSEPKPAAGAVEKHEPVGYLWSRLSSRLFGTEQS
jgi:hypothetical protein